MILFIKSIMITSLLSSTILVKIIKNEEQQQQQNSTTLLHENSDIKSSSYLKETVTINVGKRVRFECELENLTNMEGLWLRIEDAEVFFYSLSRINSDHRFQVEKRAGIKILSPPSTS
ncbi:unnamed protein product, partial [Didymodactylos carnosus]